MKKIDSKFCRESFNKESIHPKAYTRYCRGLRIKLLDRFVFFNTDWTSDLVLRDIQITSYLWPNHWVHLQLPRPHVLYVTEPRTRVMSVTESQHTCAPVPCCDCVSLLSSMSHVREHTVARLSMSSVRTQLSVSRSDSDPSLVPECQWLLSPAGQTNPCHHCSGHLTIRVQLRSSTYCKYNSIN